MKDLKFTTSPKNRIFRELAIALFLFVFTFLLYQNSIHHAYSFDDYYVIHQNPKIQQGIDAIPEIFTSRYHDEEGCIFGYRPIVQTSFAVEYEFFGANPSTSHLINIIFYCIIIVLLWFLLRKLLKDHHFLLPLFIVLLFAAHPLHTEAVVNVKNRDTLLSFLFSLLALISFIRFVETRRIWGLFAGIVCFVIAYFAKEEAITFAVIIPVAIFFFTPLKLPTFRGIGPWFAQIKIGRMKLPPMKWIRNPVLWQIILILALTFVSFWSFYKWYDYYIGGSLYHLALGLMIYRFIKKKPRGPVTFKSLFLNPFMIIGIVIYVYSYVVSDFFIGYAALFFFGCYFLKPSVPAFFRWIRLMFKKDPGKTKRKKFLSFEKDADNPVPFPISRKQFAFLLIAAILASLAVVVYHAHEYFLPAEFLDFNRAENPLLVNDPDFTKFTLGFSSLMFYIEKLFWPHPLGFYYGFNMIPAASWNSLIVLSSVAIHAGLLILALILLKRKHIISFAILYYLAAISIFTNFIMPVPGIVAERFLFSASLAFCIIVSWLIFRLFNIKKETKLTILKKVLVLSTLILILLPYSYKTITRNRVWKNYDTLFSHDKEYLKNSVKAQYTFAKWQVKGLFDDQRSGRRGSENVARAMKISEHLLQILTIDSTYKYAWNNLGVLYSEILNQNRQSMTYYDIAVQIDTNYHEAWFNFGVAMMREGNVPGGIAIMEKAIQLNSIHLQSVSDLADSYFMERRLREPMFLYPLVIKYDSTMVSAVKNLGYCYLINKDTTQAVLYLEKAFDLDPSHQQLGMDLVRFYLSTGDTITAERMYVKVNAYKKEE